MIVLQVGRIGADGEPASVLTPALLERVFGGRANIVIDPASGAPVCLPYALVAPEGMPTPSMGPQFLLTPMLKPVRAVDQNKARLSYRSTTLPSRPSWPAWRSAARTSSSG